MDFDENTFQHTHTQQTGRTLSAHIHHQVSLNVEVANHRSGNVEGDQPQVRECGGGPTTGQGMWRGTNHRSGNVEGTNHKSGKTARRRGLDITVHLRYMMRDAPESSMAVLWRSTPPHI